MSARKVGGNERGKRAKKQSFCAMILEHMVPLISGRYPLMSGRYPLMSGRYANVDVCNTDAYSNLDVCMYRLLD